MEIGKTTVVGGPVSLVVVGRLVVVKCSATDSVVVGASVVVAALVVGDWVVVNSSVVVGGGVVGRGSRNPASLYCSSFCCI